MENPTKSFRTTKKNVHVPVQTAIAEEKVDVEKKTSLVYFHERDVGRRGGVSQVQKY